MSYEICACGKILYPIIKNGKQIGVTHESEDEDWHYQFFAGYSIVLNSDKNLEGSDTTTAASSNVDH